LFQNYLSFLWIVFFNFHPPTCLQKETCAITIANSFTYPNQPKFDSTRVERLVQESFYSTRLPLFSIFIIFQRESSGSKQKCHWFKVKPFVFVYPMGVYYHRPFCKFKLFLVLFSLPSQDVKMNVVELKQEFSIYSLRSAENDRSIRENSTIKNKFGCSSCRVKVQVMHEILPDQ